MNPTYTFELCDALVCEAYVDPEAPTVLDVPTSANMTKDHRTRVHAAFPERKTFGYIRGMEARDEYHTSPLLRLAHRPRSTSSSTTQCPRRESLCILLRYVVLLKCSGSLDSEP